MPANDFLREVQSGTTPVIVTEPRILMKAGAYSDSLTVAKGDRSMRFCIVVLLSTAIFRRTFLNTKSQDLDKIRQMFSTHWFMFWFLG